MDIRFISSLTPEDECRIAEAVCAVVGSLLDQFSVVYTIRIETSDGQLLHRCTAPSTVQAVSDAALN
jgi:hypothetical protein